jgi:hypothetical protein
MLQTLHALDSDQHVAFTSFWRMGSRVARVPPLREPTRSLGSERDEKASAHFGRDDSLAAAVSLERPTTGYANRRALAKACCCDVRLQADR